MRNSNKSGDFNLDEELKSRIVAEQDESPLEDDHEEEGEFFGDLNAEKKLEREMEIKYHINPHIKRKPELILVPFKVVSITQKHSLKNIWMTKSKTISFLDKKEFLTILKAERQIPLMPI